MDIATEYLESLGLIACESIEELEDSVVRAVGVEEAARYNALMEEYEYACPELYAAKNSDYKACMAWTGGFDYYIFKRTINWIEKRAEYFGEEILDVGSDCGVITCYLAKRFPDSHITAVERCHEAILIAKENAHKLGLTNIDFINEDICDVEKKQYDTVFTMRTLQENRNENVRVGGCEIFSQQAQLYKNAAVEYANLLSSFVKESGTIVSIERVDRDPFFVSWIYALAENECGILLDTYNQLKCKEICKTNHFQAFVAQKGNIVTESQVFDYLIDKIKLNPSDTQYFGWDSLFELELIIEDLVEGYFIYNDRGMIIGQFSIFEINRPGMRAYLNNSGYVDEMRLMIFPKEDTMQYVSHMKQCVDHNVNNCGFTAKKIAYKNGIQEGI